MHTSAGDKVTVTEIRVAISNSFYILLKSYFISVVSFTNKDVVNFKLKHQMSSPYFFLSQSAMFHFIEMRCQYSSLPEKVTICPSPNFLSVMTICSYSEVKELLCTSLGHFRI